ncbi:pollen-specific leucine-rich repeat extensin-like protein 1 [Punica granatum]|uniref:Pollen-specific leucine-rich repeat extensin-like protein 1 n=1 Tax=Punica granatum TaxID=22663 RepID=A0A6P8DYD9_PUNGR|nr:pollen-specific leucine-rich repeat extensin-like protein 1 [Punica granatum]
MAEEDRVDISEEVNPPVPVHSQPPPTHAPPPPTLAGILSAYLGAPPTHLPPPTSSGAPLPQVSLTSSASDDQTRITALEGTVNQLAASMAANMAELLALLRGSNRASSSSTPPPGQGPTVDPIPWVPPTQVPENTDAPAPPTLHMSMAHPFTSPFPPPPAPTAVPLPQAAFLTSDQVLSAPPPISLPAPAAAYTIPPPTIFPAPSAPAPTRPQVADLPSYPPLQLHINFSYQARPPINTTFLEPGTPTHAAQVASPTHFFPEADAEQERRLKRMEETIRALQASDTRPDARYGDCSLFLGMQLPPKFKIPEFKTYKANPLPDHGPGSGPSINMITICTSGRDEDAQDNPLPFVIDYTPEEPTVGFAGHMASPAPFVVDVPAREPYSDSKVPWTYERGIGSVEQQFSVMGVTRSG